MANIIDYLKWRGDITFEQVKLGEVDNLILSLLAFVDFTDIVSPDPSAPPVMLKQAAMQFFFENDIKKNQGPGLIINPQIYKMFRMMAESKRFGQLELSAFVNEVDLEEEKQFCALTIRLKDSISYISVRGTDDTIVGWKEDFNLLFLDEIPSQRRVVEYVNAVCTHQSGNFYVGGHSKGGHLALYAAVKCAPEHKNRIVAAFSNDGPGFSKAFTDLPEYQVAESKFHIYMPQKSVIGMFFENKDKRRVVKSKQVGVFQHDAVSWEVMGGNFVRAKKLSKGVGDIVLLNDRIHALPIAARKHFVDVLFGMLESTGVKTLSELNARSLKHIITMIRTFNDMDQREQDLMLLLIAEMLDLRLMSDKTIDVNNDE